MLRLYQAVVAASLGFRLCLASRPARNQGLVSDSLQKLEVEAELPDGLFIFDRSCEKVHLFTDMEGDYAYLESWLEGLTQQQALTYEPSFIRHPDPTTKHKWLPTGSSAIAGFPYYKILLKQGHCICNAGDMLDGGGQENRQGVFRGVATFLELQRTHAAGRVILLVGNRDANKMRLTSELFSAAAGWQGRQGPLMYFTAPGVLEKDQTVESCSKCIFFTSKCKLEDEKCMAIKGNEIILKKTEIMKWIYANSMGAGATIKCHQEELTEIKGPSSSTTEDEVVEYIEAQLTDGGLFHDYLANAVPVATTALGKAIFLHGGVGGCVVGADGLLSPVKETATTADRPEFGPSVSPEAAKRIAAYGLDLSLKPASRTSSGIPTNTQTGSRNAMDWARAWAQWKQEQFNDWKAQPSFLPHASLLLRGGNGLMDAVLEAPAGGFRNSGFTMCSPIMQRSMDKLSDEIASWLTQVGVTTVWTGHSPIGAIPGMWKTGDVTLINADLTYAHPPKENSNMKYQAGHITDVSPLAHLDVGSNTPSVKGLIMKSTEGSDERSTLAYELQTDLSSCNETSEWAGPDDPSGKFPWTVQGKVVADMPNKTVTQMHQTLAAQPSSPDNLMGFVPGPPTGFQIAVGVCQAR